MNLQKLLYRNILWRGLFYVSAFILNISIARHFGAALSGKLYYLFNIYTFITLLTGLSLESGIIYFGAKDRIPRQALLNFSILWVCVTGIILLITFSCISYFLNIKIDEDVFIYAVVFVCGNILITCIGGLFYARKEFAPSNLVGIIINIALIVLLLSINNKQITNDRFFLIYFGSFLLQGLILAIVLIKKFQQPFKLFLPSVSQLKALFRYCLFAFVANFVSLLLYRVDYWFVNRYCTQEQLGNYIQVSKLAQLFFVLPGILASAVFPLTAGDHQQQVNNSLMMLSRILLLSYSLICGILAITGRWLFPIIFGESFTGMYMPFLFLIPGILGLSTLYTLTAYYAGKNMIAVNLKGSTIALFFMIIADAVFIPKYGINAAAAVSSVCYIIYHIYVLSIFTKEYKTPAIGFFYFRFSDLQFISRSIKNM